MECFDSSKWKSVEHGLKLKKKFRWFFTYFSYTEIFKKVNPYSIPIENYLSKKELELWSGESRELIIDKDSVEQDKIRKSIDNKIEKWLKQCFSEKLSKYLKQVIEIINDPSIKYNWIKDNIDTITVIYWEAKDYSRFIELLVNFSHNENFNKLLDKKYEAIINKSKKDAQFLDYFHEEYFFKTLLPGKLIKTNAGEINHDTLIWKVTAYKFFFKNYELSAESFIPNYWAFFLTGTVILIITAFLFLKRNKF